MYKLCSQKLVEFDAFTTSVREVDSGSWRVKTKSSKKSIQKMEKDVKRDLVHFQVSKDKSFLSPRSNNRKWSSLSSRKKEPASSNQHWIHKFLLSFFFCLSFLLLLPTNISENFLFSQAKVIKKCYDEKQCSPSIFSLFFFWWSFSRFIANTKYRKKKCTRYKVQLVF